MSKKNYIALNEEGFASIVIALILIVVLALLTVGFAQLARREQQDALDKQLASQAFDAAESGVNDASKDIKTGAINSVNASSTTCMTGPSASYGTKTLPIPALTATPMINSNNGVGYTCLLVNLTPASLGADLNVGTSWATIFSINSGAGLQSFDVNWVTKDNQNATPPAGTNFPPIGPNSGQWGNSPATLQFSITPLIAEDRASLIANTLTAYLRPSTDPSASLHYPASSILSNNQALVAQNQGQIIPAQCSAGNCTTHVIFDPNGSIASQPNEVYLIEAIPYYDSSHITVDNGVANNSPVDFTDSQAVVDVTGQAKQVLKRLQEEIPLNPVPALSDYALEAQDICKRFTTYPGLNNTQPSPPPGYSGTACQL